MDETLKRARLLTSVRDERFRVEIDKQTFVLVINRPEARNALTFQMYRDLGVICELVNSSRDLRAFLLLAEGERAFASGTDIKEFRQFADASDAIAYERDIGNVLDQLESCNVPTIAALSGACTGGGFAIAACCDIRIAQDNLQLGLPMARTLGNCLSLNNLARFSAILGEARVAEMMLTTRLMGAVEALSVGVVSEVLANRETLLSRAKVLADTIASHAPITLQVTKTGLQRLRKSGRCVDGEDLVVRAYSSDDFREGLSAFLEKRSPRWLGR